MKIFETYPEYTDKVNFVDQNNVVLGYSLSQCCCEHAGWFISDTPKDTIQDESDTDLNLDDYYFDTAYFKEVGYLIIFRITDGTNEKFVHIFNDHNGYYSHGFDFQRGNVMIEEGYI